MWQSHSLIPTIFIFLFVFPSVIARHTESMSWQSHTLLPTMILLKSINHELKTFYFLLCALNFQLSTFHPHYSTSSSHCEHCLFSFLRHCESTAGRCGNLIHCSPHLFLSSLFFYFLHLYQQYLYLHYPKNQKLLTTNPVLSILLA